jgi:hypothetical protein
VIISLKLCESSSGAKTPDITAPSVSEEMQKSP